MTLEEKQAEMKARIKATPKTRPPVSLPSGFVALPIPRKAKPAYTIAEELYFAEKRLEAKRRREAEAKAHLKPRQDRSGWIYLIGCTERNWYKIGLTRRESTKARIRAISTNMPFRIDYERAWACPDSYTAEARLHRRFHKQRLNGEWFEIKPDKLPEVLAVAERIASDPTQRLTCRSTQLVNNNELLTADSIENNLLTV